MDLTTVTWRKSSHSGHNGGNCIEVALLTKTVEPHAPVNRTWRKSTHSGNTGGDCVEAARMEAVIGLRDSKNPDAGHLTLPAPAFAALLTHLKHGDLNA